MPIEQVIINASPLITLFASDQQNILPKLFNKIIVPEEVWEEVSVSSSIKQLQKAGLWLGEELVSIVLKEAGEL